MDTTQGLQLLAESSWGVTRQLLHQAIKEIESLRLQLIEASEAVEMAWEAQYISWTEQDQDKLDELWGRLNASVEQIERKQEELNNGQ